MTLRAFTLLEVLVAVAIVAMLSALALPAVLSRLGDAQLNSAARQMEAAVISVRAQAQREGRAVALMATHGPRTIRLRAEPLGVNASELDFGDDEEMEASVPRTIARGDGQRDSAAGGRRLGSLPEGVVASHGPRPVPERDSARNSGVMPGEALPPLRVAVALPDGTMIVPGPLRLTKGERAVQVRVNRFTGVCTVERERSAPAAGEEPVDEDRDWQGERR